MRFIKGLFALLVTAAVIVGGPMALTKVAGNPLPRHWPSLGEITQALTTPDDGSLFLRLLAVIGWVAWATLTLSLLVEIPARLRGRRAVRLPGLGIQQRVAAVLVGAIMAIFIGSSVATAMTSPQAAAPAPKAVQTSTYQQAAQHVQQQHQVYVVRRGDYLGRIAKRFTGDFESYHDIAALNKRLIRNPNLIQPGWKLVLPQDSRDRGVIKHATGRLLEPPAAPNPPTAPKPPAAPVVPPPPIKKPVVERILPQQTPPLAQEQRNGVNTSLVAGAGLAAASVLVAHVVVRRRIRRMYQIQVRQRRITRAFRLEHSRQSARHSTANRLDAGMRYLAIALRDRAEHPDIAAAWQNGGDVAVILTAPSPNPPGPYEDVWQNTWSLPAHAKLPDTFGATSLLPALMTFCTWPHGGELLVDAERTGLITLTGDPIGCDNLLRCLAAEAATSSWAEGARVQIAGLSAADMQAITSLNPNRVRVNPSIPDALARISRRAEANSEALRLGGVTDTMGARIGNVTEAAWATHLLFIADPWGEHTAELRELDAQLAGLRRVGVAVVATHPTATRWSATVRDDGSLHMAWLAVGGVNACQLSSDQLAEMASVLSPSGARHRLD